MLRFITRLRDGWTLRVCVVCRRVQYMHPARFTAPCCQGRKTPHAPIPQALWLAAPPRLQQALPRVQVTSDSRLVPIDQRRLG